MKFLMNGTIVIRLDGNEKVIDLPEESPVREALELITKDVGGAVLDELMGKVLLKLPQKSDN